MVSMESRHLLIEASAMQWAVAMRVWSVGQTFQMARERLILLIEVSAMQ
jgi:hypothetical protein